MALQVFRCADCRREVLVRIPAPLTAGELAQRREEELRPSATGRRAPHVWSDRLRDDIWLGLSGAGVAVPRAAPPDRCPACGRAHLERARIIE